MSTYATLYWNGKQRGSIYIKFFILFVYLFSFKTKELEKEIQKKHKALM